jgi:hypothetical protein
MSPLSLLIRPRVREPQVCGAGGLPPQIERAYGLTGIQGAVLVAPAMQRAQVSPMVRTGCTGTSTSSQNARVASRSNRVPTAQARPVKRPTTNARADGEVLLSYAHCPFPARSVTFNLIKVRTGRPLA